MLKIKNKSEKYIFLNGKYFLKNIIHYNNKYTLITAE
jgi:hypothetical protein